MLYSVESILKNTRVGEDKKNGDEEEEEEEEEDEEEEVENKNKRNRMYCFLFLSIKADIIPRSHTKFPFFFFEMPGPYNVPRNSLGLAMCLELTLNTQSSWHISPF